MAKGNKLKYFYENHPATLVEQGGVEELEILNRKLEVAQSWDSFMETFAFTDLTILLDQLKTAAYQEMVSAEEDERRKQSGYKSDAWLKGRLSALADLKHHISTQRTEIPYLLSEIKELSE